MSQAEIAALRMYHNAVMSAPWNKTRDLIANLRELQRVGLAALRVAHVNTSIVEFMEECAREDLAGVTDNNVSRGEG
tara:strand:+ start:561 stop:791 length:231 start_codon:yes stop_codon:yes gene_type:complete